MIYREYDYVPSLAEAPRASRWRRFRGWMRGSIKKWELRRQRRLVSKWDNIEKKSQEVMADLNDLVEKTSPFTRRNTPAEVFFHALNHPYSDDCCD